jgi:FtsX-like permease family
VRAALGASRGALRRTLLAESLVLCAAGAVAGVYLSDPLVTLMARYAARFSVRALDVTLDSSVAWVGAGLAMTAAVLLAFVPRLPSSHASSGPGLTSSTVRITPGTNRRLRTFATTQIAFSFVLLAGAAMLLGSLVTLQTGRTGYDMRRVLALEIPTPAPGLGRDTKDVLAFYDESMRRIAQIPGVDAVAAGTFVPWRDAGDVFPRIAVVGIACVLAFSVSARTREFGMRMAVGCSPRALLTHVLSQGTAIAGIGIAAGAAGGFVLSRVVASFTPVQLPGALAMAAAAAVLLTAAVVASWLPAARASRIDIIEALRAE